jgi:hypothetical protein
MKRNSDRMTIGPRRPRPGDKDYVKSAAHIAYDLATMQERLGWPRLPDPLNGDDVRNYRTELAHNAYMAIYNATGRSWDDYPEIPPLDFFAQPKLAIRIVGHGSFEFAKQVEPEEALAIFSACVKKEADIKREIVEGSVITRCPMCLARVWPRDPDPACQNCNVNLEPVLRPRRLLAYPGIKVDCAAFIDELHQISRMRKWKRRA